MNGARGTVAQRKFVRDHETEYINEIEKTGVEVARDLDMQPWKDKVFTAMVDHVKETFPKAAAHLGAIEAEGNK